MKKDILMKSSYSSEEPIVIADECGDSMWDAVLQQEIKICEIKPGNVELNLMTGSDEAKHVGNEFK